MNGLNDGYGDDLSNAEVIERFERWAHAVANTIREPFHEMHDDLAQEGLLALWEALDAKGGKANVSATYLALAGKHRMRDVAHGRPMAGNPAQGGQTYRPTTVSAQAVEEAAPDLWDQLTSVDSLGDVEIAYHHGEIMEALSGLKPQYRRYVELRFWHGMRDVEIAPLLGTTNKIVGTWWSRTIRPTLQARLAHLQGVS